MVEMVRVGRSGFCGLDRRGRPKSSYRHALVGRDHTIHVSMSRKAPSWDIGACESFMKTWKSEDVHRSEYPN
jgi:hypothetical protein